MGSENKCDCCGKFRKTGEVVMVGGENFEWWWECIYCFPQHKECKPDTPTTEPSDVGFYQLPAEH